MGALSANRTQDDEGVDHFGLAGEQLNEGSRLLPDALHDIAMPDGQEVAFEVGILETGRDAGEIGSHGAADQAEDGGKRHDGGDIVSEVHGAAAEKRLAGAIDGHGEGEVDIGGGARFVGEESSGGQGAHLALHANGDSLPYAEMPVIALRRRGPGQLEKHLQAIRFRRSIVGDHGNMLPRRFKHSAPVCGKCVYDSQICAAETL